MKNRKNLPPFLKLKRTIDINLLISHLDSQGLLDFSKYNDININTAREYKNFLLGNSFSKNNFFLEENAKELTGELYKQLYITKFKYEQQGLLENATSTKTRLKRLIKNNSNYIPELDEHNYGEPNEYYKGYLKQVLDSFQSPLTRVRLAVLFPQMNIKKHRDYDPSYVCRYHIPIITNDLVEFGITVGNEDINFKMSNDGSIYFFNSGLPHWVNNFSNKARLHLIIDTNGQLDLNN